MNNKDKFLEKRKIKLKPIIKPGGMNPKGHDGEFMYTGTEIIFVLPYNVRKGRLESVLTPEEQKFFEEALDEDLSIHRKTNNFWHRFSIRIRKDDKLMDNGYELDLSDPLDNLRYRLLKIQPLVAPDWESRFRRGEYRFALVDERDEEIRHAEQVDVKKEAYLFLGKIEDSKTKMYDFLRVMGKMPPKNSSKESLKKLIDDMISDPKMIHKVLEAAKDEDYEIKLLINNAVDLGVIEKKRNKYYLPGGDPINPMDSTLKGTVEKLKEYKRDTDDIYLMILTQVNESK